MNKLMSQKEANRAQVLGLLEERGISQKEAAKWLRGHGTSGASPGGIGRRDCQGCPAKREASLQPAAGETLRAKATALIGAHYCGFEPTLANEKQVGWVELAKPNISNRD